MRVRTWVAVTSGVLAVTFGGWVAFEPWRFTDVAAQDEDLGVELVDAFPGIGFDNPLLVTHAPGDRGRLFVVEQDGVVHVLEIPAPEPPALATRTVFLDVSDRTRGRDERGLLGLAFHPDHAANGRFFVHYSRRSDGATVIAEYAVSAQDPDVAEPESERVLLTVPQPFSNHNGGMIEFGPDGMLYIGLGDGGSSGDPRDNGEDLSTLLGSILRIDVDGTDPGLQYRIPADNPFVLRAGARGEIWAYGLRNPWRFSFDRETGELWCGDVGQNRFEEIDRVTRGGHYGWDVKEGFSDFEDPDLVVVDPLVDPVVVYDQSQGRSVTGGFVYRGTQIPGLTGAYLYADFVSGRVWTLRGPPDGDPTPDVDVLFDTNHTIASFGEDAAGEIYVASFGGLVLKVVAVEAPPAPPDDLPDTLSETGLFRNLPGLDPVDGALRYAVNTQLWSDSAKKDRFVVLPPGEAMEYRDDGPFGFPVGAWIVKTFTLKTGGKKRRNRLETRVMLRTEDGWEMGAYRWRPDLSDGDLVQDRLTEVVDGRRGQQTWTFPSRADCRSCHTDASARVLGVTARQLRHPARRGRDLFKQWAKAGVLTGQVPRIRDVTRNLPVKGRGRIDRRARSYLSSNCAYCHRPGAPQPAGLDLRARTPLSDTGLLNAPERDDLGIVGARIVAPGNPAQSALLARIRLREPGDDRQMPPLGSHAVDGDAVRTLKRWIRKLQ